MVFTFRWSSPAISGGGVPLVVVEVNHILVLFRQGQDGLQHFLVLLGDRGGQIRRCLQGHGPAAEDAFQQIFAGVEGDPDEPGLLVLPVGERGRVEGVLEKNGLKDVLGVRVVFRCSMHSRRTVSAYRSMAALTSCSLRMVSSLFW